MRSFKKLLVVAVAAAAVTVGTATAVAAVPTLTFTGTTSQVLKGIRGKVRLVVTPGPRAGIRIDYHTRCAVHTSGYNNSLVSTNLKIRNGSFARTGAFAFRGPGGLSAGLGFSLSGQFTTTRRVSGKLSVRLMFRNPNGTINDRCSALGIRWHASR